MRVLITGARGMLARSLLPELERRGHTVAALSRQQLDVTVETDVASALETHAPEVVVQCAAYTAVDDAEHEEDRALEVNARATGIVARACRSAGALLVYPSTDYVFPGTGTRPYRPDDPTQPVNAYGRSKRRGEVEAQQAGRWLIVRTGWLYGRGGGNFVATISRLARERDTLQVVHDQVGRPTWTGTLARALAELSERGCTGTLHVTDGGEAVSWYGFAQEIVRQQELSTTLRPVTSREFSRPAPRPSYSVLDCASAEAALGWSLPDWRESLGGYLRADAE